MHITIPDPADNFHPGAVEVRDGLGLWLMCTPLRHRSLQDRLEKSKCLLSSSRLGLEDHAAFVVPALAHFDNDPPIAAKKHLATPSNQNRHVFLQEKNLTPSGRGEEPIKVGDIHRREFGSFGNAS